MIPLRTAVIGTGHLGRIHAKLAAEAPHIDLVAIVDVSEEARNRVASEFGTRPVADYRQLLGEIEGAIVATPTVHHFQVASDLLKAGIHVLVEKPITTTVDEATALVSLADQRNLVLQVGHVERFNPGLECVADRLHDARYLQASRTSGFTFRSTDIGVVMDLMIHDIDIVLSIVPSPVVEVAAMGLSVLTPHEDMAQAQLRFANGCQAQLTASRVSYVPSRWLQVYTPRGFAHVDFANRKGTLVEPTEEVRARRFDIGNLTAEQTAHLRDHLFEELLVKQEIEPPATNAIAEEHRDFVASIRQGHQPRVPGRAGRDALEVAELVLDSIARHRWDGTSHGRIGPAALPQRPGGVWMPTHRKAG